MSYDVDIKFAVSAPTYAEAAGEVANARARAGTAGQVESQIIPSVSGYDAIIAYKAQVPTEEAANHMVQNAHHRFRLGSTPVDAQILPAGTPLEFAVPERRLEDMGFGAYQRSTGVWYNEAMPGQLFTNREAAEKAGLLRLGKLESDSIYRGTDGAWYIEMFPSTSYQTHDAAQSALEQAREERRRYLGLDLDVRTMKTYENAYEDVRPSKQGRPRGGGGMPRSARPRIRN